MNQLHPQLQYHIVNTLGWTQLRPIQELCIDQILQGGDVLIQAPTAGGKTESAFFPVISKMIADDWRGLSILYISPLRALLNNQIDRLQKYFSMVGYTAGLWHGDVGPNDKKKLVFEPPHCLLTTPESLEAILTSRWIEAETFLGSLKVAVIDEVHAFADSDRGWHLLSVLARMEKICSHRIQRIGLSATVGNASQVGSWFSGSNAAIPVLKTTAISAEPQVQIDYVGKLENAAMVISKLHAGEKRLVFCDSRSRVEKLGAHLKSLGMKTFVTHGSLSRETRKVAEDAFATEKDCVIVATSALELGIDIGDLDRVIQVDSPGRVASFLQRMGRTGRRSGTVANCLFLATSESELLECAALIRLWKKGFVEDAITPPLPYHILAQQIMALALQQKGIATFQVSEWLSTAGDLGSLSKQKDILAAIIKTMKEKNLLVETDAILWFGEKGESEYGRKNFLELLSVFLTQPLLAVYHGPMEIGSIDQSLFLAQQQNSQSKGEEQTILTLGGKHWGVVTVDLRRKHIKVVPVKFPGRSNWLGSGRPISFELSQEILKLLCDSELDACWSKRATEGIQQIREHFSFLSAMGPTYVTETDEVTVYTFAGTLANLVLSSALTNKGWTVRKCTETMVIIVNTKGPVDLFEDLQTIVHNIVQSEGFNPSPKDLAALKFSECLPDELAQSMWKTRTADPKAIAWLQQGRWTMSQMD